MPESVRHHLARQPCAVGGEAARRHVVQPDAYLRSRIAFSISAWRQMISLQFQGLSVPVGDEAVIAVGGEEGQLGTGASASPSRTMSRTGRCVRLTLKRGVSRLGDYFRRRRPSSREWESSPLRGIASIRSRRLARWRMVMEKPRIHPALSVRFDESVGTRSRCRPAPFSYVPLAPALGREPWLTVVTHG